MSVLYGTDFSPGSRDALRVAAMLASRRNEPLLLVHAIDTALSAAWDEDLHARGRSAAALRLRDAAEEARALGIARIEEFVDEGAAGEVLVARSNAQHASLIVIGAIGRPAESSRPIGHTAAGVAASAESPVLVVHHAPPIEAWLRGERALKVVVGDDLTATSEAALRWTADLRRLGSCDIVACHVFPLMSEKARLGIGGSLYERVPEIEQASLAALRRHAGPILGTESVRYRAEGTLGRAAEPLLDMAAEEAPDLIVVGTGQRNPFSRAWHGWSSQIVLNHARSNVACIPAGDTREQGPVTLPALRQVLVATDFSPIANQAVSYGFALVAHGGTVHILHVEDPEHDRSDALQRLQGLIPENASEKDIVSRFEVVSDRSVAAAITAAAERLDVDVVCMGTHGRSGLSGILFGSVARAVVARCLRQVILVSPRRAET